MAAFSVTANTKKKCLSPGNNEQITNSAISKLYINLVKPKAPTSGE